MLKLAIPVLHVSSAVAAEEFYCQRLGFQQQSANRFDAHTADLCYMDLRRDGVQLHISAFAGDGVSGGVVFLLVEDVDALYAEFVGQGVPIARSPTNQTWGNREMYVKDADGNSLRFVQASRH